MADVSSSAAAERMDGAPEGGAGETAGAGAQGPLERFLQLWHDPNDEPYGIVYAVTEVFPDELMAELKRLLAVLPPHVEAALARGDENGARAAHVLVGLLGCLREGVLDVASAALVAIGARAVPALDGARTFGYAVDLKEGRNTLALFGERAVWEKMVRKTIIGIDPKRGNLVTRLVAKFFT